MTDETGPVALFRASKGDILIFRVSRTVNTEAFAKWTKIAAERMKAEGITAVFLSDDVELYAAVGE